LTQRTDPTSALKSGFTTGTAAAAAAKGALLLLLTAHAPTRVDIRLLTGDMISIPIHSSEIIGHSEAVCMVIKDAGDDPDVTHHAEIGARIKRTGDETDIAIIGGIGVGQVTKPGLEIPPGHPAINPGPRRMITEAVRDVLHEHGSDMSLSVEIFVPKGQELARKTLNARLGIVGGISILGTTGIVKPMSHDAYIASIVSALSVAKASGLDTIVLTTGRRSERYAQGVWKDLPEEAFVQMGDFFQASLQASAEKGFKEIRIAAFFGKALKMAQGFAHTHAAKSELTMKMLSGTAAMLTRDQGFVQQIGSANTARHALEIIKSQYPEIIAYIGHQMAVSASGFAPDRIIHTVIMDYDGTIIFQ
jgi:cobalt-precorrin-5B (C1)-methyltransferase